MALNAARTSLLSGPANRAHYEAFPMREPISDMVHIDSLNITGNLGFADCTSSARSSS